MNDETCYVFPRWDELHNRYSGGKRPVGRLSWFAVPVMLDSVEWAELASADDGAATLGVMLALWQVAAVQPSDRRGLLLIDDARPHTAKTLAMVTRLPAQVIAAAVNRLKSAGIIDERPIASIRESVRESPDKSGQVRTSPHTQQNRTTTEQDRTDRTGQDRTGQDIVAGSLAAQASPDATSVSFESESMETGKRLLERFGIRPTPPAKLARFARLVELAGPDDVAAALGRARKNGVSPILSPTLAWIIPSLAVEGHRGIAADLDAAMKGGAK